MIESSENLPKEPMNTGVKVSLIAAGLLILSVTCVAVVYIVGWFMFISEKTAEEESGFTTSLTVEDDNGTPADVVTPAQNGANAEVVLEFASSGFQVKITGINSPDTFNLFDYEIFRTDYSNEQDLTRQVVQDFPDKWGEYLFYLPSTDQYYLQFPGSSFTFEVISFAEIQDEYVQPVVVDNGPDGSTSTSCVMNDGFLGEIDVYLLKCTSISTTADGKYQTTSSKTHWLYKVDDDNYLMYEIISFPAGSEMDSRDGSEMEGVLGIEVISG